MTNLISLDKVLELIEKIPTEKAHTYASENADIYRAYDAGQEKFKQKVLAALSNRLKNLN